jgi:transposase
MKKFREIIRLAETSKLSQRQIALALNVSRPVVSDTIQKFKNSNISYEELAEMSDTDLNNLLSEKQQTTSSKADMLKQQFPDFAKELKNTGVTRQLLWEEYIEKNPDGLRYTQFCFHFQQWQKDEKISLHINHKAGDKMFVDYTGDKMEIIKPSGERIPAEVFVAILGASQLTYAEASLNQTQESFVRSNEHAIRYFGGVPAAIVPDNLKAGVIKPNIYEPDLNPLFADFAEYYRTAVLPARAGKPKDKSPVENAVKIVYQRVFAPLRNRTFHSIEELNQAIKERLEVHNSRKLTGMTVSRRELFEEIERKQLKALPISPYPIKYIQDNTLVGFNYHIELKEDKHYYSVPYLLRKQRVKIIYDDRNVAIYHDNLRICQHRRNRNSHKYTTMKEHMPEKHRFQDNWNPEKLKSWAGSIGDETKKAITHILEAKTHPEQAYKSCLGILGQAKKYGHTVLNLACRRALNMERVNYPTIAKEAEQIHEQYEQENESKQKSLLPQMHENVRGTEYYH